MAEGAPLLREYVGKTCIEGSNPSDSASVKKSEEQRARAARFLRPSSLRVDTPGAADQLPATSRGGFTAQFS